MAAIAPVFHLTNTRVPASHLELLKDIEIAISCDQYNIEHRYAGTELAETLNQEVAAAKQFLAAVRAAFHQYVSDLPG